MKRDIGECTIGYSEDGSIMVTTVQTDCSIIKLYERVDNTYKFVTDIKVKHNDAPVNVKDFNFNPKSYTLNISYEYKEELFSVKLSKVNGSWVFV